MSDPFLHQPKGKKMTGRGKEKGEKEDAGAGYRHPGRRQQKKEEGRA